MTVRASTVMGKPCPAFCFDAPSSRKGLVLMATKVKVPQLEGPDDSWLNFVQSARAAELSQTHFRRLCREGGGPPSYPTGRKSGGGYDGRAWRKSDVLRWKAGRRGPSSNGH